MAMTNPGHVREHGIPRGPQVMLTAAFATAAAGSAAAIAMLPRPLVLPVLSVLLIMIAASVALVAWRFPLRARRGAVNYWDIAGVLTFAGICAALLSEPEQVLPLLESRRPE